MYEGERSRTIRVAHNPYIIKVLHYNIFLRILRRLGPNMMRRSVAHNHVNSASDQLRTHLISSKMADWEEIKRLAADFQRAQLSSTAHKLSERNCVEIVQKLIHLGLIEVIYTTDGKEYLTPQQLEREIKDELFVHGGKYLYKCFYI